MNVKANKFLASALATVMTVSMGTTAFAADFTDMPAKDYWSYEAMQAAVDNGLLKGDSGLLNPKGLLTRAEMATVVNRAFGAAQTADLKNYTDVEQTAWYYMEMAKAVKMKTFQGSGTTLNPQNSITRQEAFAVLARALHLPAGDVTVLNKFTDGAQVMDSLKAEFAAMVAAGYVAGSDNMINPTGTITREEFAQVMHNVVKSYVSATEAITTLADGNVMVNVPNATLKGVTVKGDLIVGDGVGAGDITLDGVTVEGRLVVRGGGANSVKLANGSKVSAVVFYKTADGDVRITCDSTSSIVSISIDAASGKIVVEGNADSLNIEGVVNVEIKGNINKVNVKSSGATIAVDEGFTVKEMTISGANCAVSGKGKIEKATISGNDTKFDVAGAKVTVGKDVTGTTVGGGAVEGGKDVVAPGTPGTGTGGGGGGGGGGSTASYKKDIDNLFTNNYDWIFKSFNNGTAATFVSTSLGGTVSVNVDQTKVQTIGEAIEMMKHLVYTETGKVKDCVDATIKCVNTITVKGAVLTVTKDMSVSDVQNFVLQVFDSLFDGRANWTNDTKLDDPKLAGPVEVSVKDLAGNTFVYTVERVAAAQ